MATTYKNPYQILESEIFKRFSKHIDEELTKEQTSNQWFEKAIASSFWSAVGLSGFTVVPTLQNYFGNRQLKNISKNILKYQFDKIAKGASINEEIVINICIFSLIGYEMHNYKLNEQSLSLVPKFLLRSISKLSINAAQVSLAKEMDEANYSILQHVILSSMALLCYYYETIGFIDFFCKKAMMELTISLKSNICTLELIKHPFHYSLKSYEKTSIEECLNTHLLEDYISSISNVKTKEDIELLVKRNKTNLLKDSEQFYGTFLYIEELSEGKSYDKIVSYIKNGYFRFICPSYQYLLDSCAKCYKDIIHLDLEISKRDNLYDFDRQLVSSLATWLKENRNYHCLKNKSTNNLADDITNHIISYSS